MNRFFTEKQPRRHLFVFEALADELNDFALAWRESGDLGKGNGIACGNAIGS